MGAAGGTSFVPVCLVTSSVLSLDWSGKGPLLWCGLCSRIAVQQAVWYYRRRWAYGRAI